MSHNGILGLALSLGVSAILLSSSLSPVISTLLRMPYVLVLLTATIHLRSWRLASLLLLFACLDFTTLLLGSCIGGLRENAQVSLMLKKAKDRSNWLLLELSPSSVLPQAVISKWELNEGKHPKLIPLRLFVVQASAPPTLANPKAFVRNGAPNLAFLRRSPDGASAMERFKIYHEIAHTLGPASTQYYALYYEMLALPLLAVLIASLAKLGIWNSLLLCFFLIAAVSYVVNTWRTLGESYADNFAFHQFPKEEFIAVSCNLEEIWNQELLTTTSWNAMGKSFFEGNRYGRQQSQRIWSLRRAVDAIKAGNAIEVLEPNFIRKGQNLLFSPFFFYMGLLISQPTNYQLLQCATVLVLTILLSVAAALECGYSNTKVDEALKELCR